MKVVHEIFGQIMLKLPEIIWAPSAVFLRIFREANYALLRGKKAAQHRSRICRSVIGRFLNTCHRSSGQKSILNASGCKLTQ